MFGKYIYYVINKKVKRKKILLYGGSGFVGSAIADGFKNSHTIIAPIHTELDVTDFYGLKKNISQTKPDLIIYATGLASVDKCEEEPELASLLNTKVPEIIALEAANLGVPVYYLSTDAVFRGDKTDSPYTEEDTVDPFSVYGKTKQIGEEAVLNHSNRNAIIRIICPFNTFYPRKTDFIRMAVDKLSKNEQFTGITDQITNPLYMPYLTSALQKLVVSGASGIYHLGATDSDSNFNIVKRVAQILDLDTKLITPITLEVFMRNKKSLRSQYGWLDVSKFQKEFGEGILHSLEISLKDFVKEKPGSSF